jgi:hypothetical protein
MKLGKLIIIFVILLLGECSTNIVYSQEENIIVSSRLHNQVILDGTISSPEEWSETDPLNIVLTSNNTLNPEISAQVRSKNDGEWVYFLIRIERDAEKVANDDSTGISYEWGTNENPWKNLDISSMELNGWIWDAYRKGEETELVSDEDRSPQGENNIEGFASHDGAYYWFELRKEMDSEDSYDWTLEPGNIYGQRTHMPNIGGNMKAIFFDSKEEILFTEFIQLSIVAPHPALFQISKLAINPRNVETSETITISITVDNEGELSDETQIELRVNGVLEQINTVTVSGGESMLVTFEVTKRDPGVYSVQVGDLVGEFLVTSGSQTSGFPLGMDLRDIVYGLSIIGTFVGIGGWITNRRNSKRKKELVFSKLLTDIDNVFTSFKTNSRKCEAELLNLREKVYSELSRDVIDEDNYRVLVERIEEYLVEIRNELTKF